MSALRRHIQRLKADAARRQRADDRATAAKIAKVNRAKAAKWLANRPKDDDEASGTDYLDAYLFDLQQRAYPKDRVDWSLWEKARKHRDAMPPAHLGRAGGGVHAMALGPTWEFMGPRNLPVATPWYTGEGPISGRVNAVAYDPKHPGTYYLGTSNGGLWRSTDSGAHWTPLSDTWPVLSVSSIAIDPITGDIYVGTGDFHGGGAYANGIMKSTDGGEHWITIGGGVFGRAAISTILIDPDYPNLITVATGRGGTDSWDDPAASIWRSVDSGATWTRTVNSPRFWSDLKCSAKAADGSRRYYATGATYTTELWCSTDRGASWMQLDPPLGPWGGYGGLGIALAVSPTDPSTVYLVDGAGCKVLKSTSGGAHGSWIDITGATFPGAPPSWNWYQAWYDIHARASTRLVGGIPVDVLYVGLVTLAQSPSGDANWRDISLSMGEDSVIHCDQHCMAIDPTDPNKMLVGNDGGINGLTYDPVADTWSFDKTLNKTLGVTEFYRMDAHPTDPNQVLGGAQDNNTPYTNGDLENWKNCGQGDGGFAAINPINPSIQYATCESLHIFRTVDGWATTREMVPYSGDDTVGFIAPIAIDHNHPNYLYAGTNYLYRWDENTQQWTGRLAGQRLAAAWSSLTYLAVSPSDSGRIYTGSADGQIWMTQDAGETWTRIDGGLFALPLRSITSIAVDPANPSNIYVGVSGTGAGHLWRCADTTAGDARTWSDLSGSGADGLPDVPVNTVALDIARPTSTIYVGTDVGAFATTDAGAHWGNVTQSYGLPNVRVNDLKAVPGTGMLYAATFGRGIWRIPLATAAVYLDRLDVNPTSVRGGQSATGTVTLNVAAPAGGATVLLSSDSSAATPPASVTVPEGKTAADFTISTMAVTQDTTVTVSARSGGVCRALAMLVLSSYVISGTATSGGVGLGGVTVHIDGLGLIDAAHSATPALPIPDNDATGVVSTIDVPESGVLSAIKVGVNISHPYRGDVEISIIDPADQACMLKQTSIADYEADVITSYPDATAPFQSLNMLSGAAINGTWTLKVRDLGQGHVGTLNSWSLTLTYTGPVFRTVTTAADGSYSASDLTSSSYNVWPWKTGILFTPDHRSVAVGPDQSGVDFAAPAQPTKVTVPQASGAIGAVVPLYATLAIAGDGAPVAGETLTFTVGGAAAGTAVTDAAGSAHVSYTIPAGAPHSNAIAVSYAGRGAYAASTGNGTLLVQRPATNLSVRDISCVVGQSVTLRATLTRASDGAPLANRSIALVVGDTYIDSVDTNSSGVASKSYIVPASAPPGAVSINAYFAGDGVNGGSSGSGTLTVCKLIAMTPSCAAAGGPGFTLTVTGGGFTGTSQVKWNGTPRATTYVSPAQVTAAIPAASIAAAGTANVTVWGDSGHPANALVFVIGKPSIGVSVQSVVSSGSSLSAQVVLRNTGTAPAAAVTITGATLRKATGGTADGTVTSLPVVAGTLAPGTQSGPITLAFKSGAAMTGDAVVLSIGGTFATGTFSNSIKTTVR